MDSWAPHSFYDDAACRAYLARMRDTFNTVADAAQREWATRAVDEAVFRELTKGTKRTDQAVPCRLNELAVHADGSPMSQTEAEREVLQPFLQNRAEKRVVATNDTVVGWPNKLRSTAHTIAYVLHSSASYASPVNAVTYFVFCSLVVAGLAPPEVAATVPPAARELCLRIGQQATPIPGGDFVRLFSYAPRPSALTTRRI